jgi:hypothetical protein
MVNLLNYQKNLASKDEKKGYLDTYLDFEEKFILQEKTLLERKDRLAEGQNYLYSFCLSS